MLKHPQLSTYMKLSPVKQTLTQRQALFAYEDPADPPLASPMACSCRDEFNLRPRPRHSASQRKDWMSVHLRCVGVILPPRTRSGQRRQCRPREATALRIYTAFPLVRHLANRQGTGILLRTSCPTVFILAFASYKAAGPRGISQN